MKSRIAMVGLLALMACGGSTRLDSRWPATDPVVDGSLEEWEGALSLVEDADLDIGVSNDDEFLYFSLVTLDRAVAQQIMVRGLIVWLDAAGEENRTLGIRYPVGVLSKDPGKLREMMQGRRPDQMTDEERAERLEQMRTTLNQVEIVRSGKGTGERLKLDELEFAEVSADVTASRFTYELKIPLRATVDNPLAVGASPGATIAVGLQTPKIDRSQLASMRPPGGGRPGGRGGLGGRPGGAGGLGGGGRGGRMGPGGPPSPPASIDTWLKIELQKAPDQLAQKGAER